MDYREFPFLSFGACLALSLLTGCEPSGDGAARTDTALYQCAEPAAQGLARRAADSLPVADTLVIVDSTGSDSIPVKTPRPIEVYKAFPPVAMLDPSLRPDSSLLVRNNDPRSDNGSDIQKPGSNQTGWIQPVDMGETIPRLAGLNCISIVQVVATSSFQSTNVILDSNCKVVREFAYAYSKPDTLKAATALLVWDLKDNDGKPAPSGSYSWNVRIASGDSANIYRSKVSIATGPGCE